jgi:hypothetical protein
MEQFVFTFGFEHDFPHGFIRLDGDVAETRREMFRMFGPHWAFQYRGSEFDPKDRRMREVIVVDNVPRWKNPNVSCLVYEGLDGCTHCHKSVNSDNCDDCHKMRNCSYCRGCAELTNCDHCHNCVNCLLCSHGADLVDCIDCLNCVECVDCWSCKNCTDCEHCIGEDGLVSASYRAYGEQLSPTEWHSRHGMCPTKKGEK